MILPRLDYKKARTIKEALDLFEKYKGDAIYLAGGTDLIPRIKLRLKTPSILIDIKGIEELSGIRRKGGLISIGANTTIFELKNNEIIRENYPALYEAASLTSCETLQMRGTIGGNIAQDSRCLFYNKSIEWRKAKGFCYKMGGNVCHATGGKNVCFANYSSDLSPALISLDAKLVIVGKKGERRCGIDDIYSGRAEAPFKLEAGEIIKEIEIQEGKRVGAFEKLRIRESIDYPLINGAFSLNGKGGILSIGGVGARPLIYKIESLKERENGWLFDKIYSDLKPVGNTVISADYRKKMGGIIARRLLKRVGEEV